jgi:hypothetical protein
MIPTLRLAGILVIVLLGAIASSERAIIQLSSFPTMSVADGRSTVTVTAQVRDSQGRNVADGTRILFSTTLGSFRESVATTVNGRAQVTLVAGGIAGSAVVTATPIGIDAPPTTLEFLFVSSAAELSSAQEYVELVGSGPMEYSPDLQVIAASGPDRGVYLRYREVEIRADDLQLDIQRTEVRARRAKLTIGDWSYEFVELVFRLRTRSGSGIANYRGKRFDSLSWAGRTPAFVRVDDEQRISLPQEEDRFGSVDVRPGRVTPSLVPISSASVAFQDLGESASTILAKKAVVFPRREIQFQQAEIRVGGARVMRMPLYVARLTGDQRRLVTDDFIQIDNSRIQFNYPYYLSLKPGQTSLLRFRTGGRGGRGVDAIGGMFLDYQLDWNRGDEMQGGLIFSGIGRDDWVASVRQYTQINTRTNFSAQLDSPTGQSIFGSTSFNHQLDGYRFNLFGNITRSLRGLDNRRQDVSMNLERDPVPIPGIPFRFVYGVTVNSSQSEFQTTGDGPRTVLGQDSAGLRLRAQSAPLTLEPSTSLTLDFSLSRLFWSRRTGLAQPLNTMVRGATATLSRTISQAASLVATYDYLDGTFDEDIVGKQRLTVQGFYNEGNTYLSVLAARGLDVQRTSLFADLSYRVMPQWRVAYGYTLESYRVGEFDNVFMDTTVSLFHRLGGADFGRDVGLTWSQRTGRLGVSVLGVTY